MGRRELEKALGGAVPADIRARREGITPSSGGPGGRSDAAARSPLARIIFPPWVEKLPASQDFNQNDYEVVIGAGAGTTVVAVSIALQGTMVGWLQTFSQYVLTPTAATSLTFTLRIKGGPVSGFDNVRNPPGVANLFLQNLNDCRVRVPQGGTIDVLVTNNNANGPWTIGARISGWYHPKAEEDRIYGHL